MSQPLDGKLNTTVRAPLSGKLTLFVLGISGIFTFIIVALTSYVDYRTEMDQIFRHFKIIRDSQAPIVAENLWNYDEDLLEVNLRSIMAIDHVSFVRIDSTVIKMEKGENSGSDPVLVAKDTIPLTIDHNYLGSLEVYIDKNPIFAKIYKKLMILAFLQFLKALLVSLIIVWFINLIVSSRIIKIREFIKSNFSNGEESLVLHSKLKRDEINVLGDSILVMRQKILEYQSKLEDLIKFKTRELAQRNRDLSIMLQSMEVGVFAITKELLVHKEYSRALEGILGRSKLAGINAIDLLFENLDHSGSDAELTRSALSAIFSGSYYSFQLNKNFLADRIIKKIGESGCKVLDLRWNPVVGDDDKIDKILVTVRDVTDLEDLKSESGYRRAEADIIREILDSGPGQAKIFFEESLKEVGQISKQIYDESGDALDEKTIEQLHNRFTSIVKFSDNFGFDRMSQEIGSACNILLRYMETHQSPRKYIIEDILKKVSGIIHFYNDIFYEKLWSQFKNREEEDLVSELIEFSTQKALKSGDEKIRFADLVLSRVKRLNSVSLCNVTDEITHFCLGFSQVIGIETPVISIEIDRGLRIYQKDHGKIHGLLLQCLRNCIEFGLEPAGERIQSGKDPSGKISLRSETTHDFVRLELCDDGRGLATDSLRSPEESHLEPVELLQKLLTPRFHAELVNKKDSGPWRGMDTVSDVMSQFGGQVQIQLLPKSTDNEVLHFKLIFIFPIKLFSIEELDDATRLYYREVG